MIANGVSTGSKIHAGKFTGSHRRTVVADLLKPTRLLPLWPLHGVNHWMGCRRGPGRGSNDATL